MFYNFHASLKSGALSPLSKKYIFSSTLLMLSLWTYSPLSVAKNKTEEKTLTLSSAIKRVLKESPSLKVFKFRQAALEGQQQSQSLKPAYEIGFEVDNFAGTGNMTLKDNAEFTLSLSSIFELGDKRNARLKVITTRKSHLDAQREIQALNLFGEVTRRYIDVLSAQERLSLAFEAIQLAEETLIEVEKRSKAGISPEAEIKRALAALGNARLTASSEQQQFNYSKVALAMMWNKTTPEFTRVEGNLFLFSADIPFKKLYDKVKQNPEILMYTSEKRLREAQLRLTRTESNANIKWSIGIKQFQDTNNTALNAGFSMPLFAAKRNTGAIISAKAARDEVIAKKETTLLKLHSQLYRAYANRKQAIFTTQSLRNSIIPTLTEALSETQSAYQKGRYSYLDYLTVRQELLFARRAMIESATYALNYGTEIEQLIAEPLPASQFGLTNKFQEQSYEY
ncbi:TolC family protein [Pseudoalteromonas denitrificans]|uniref:Outer membrane protein, cobalt-zinc-cadmium efflux system n=1 Tax=Pseudoalteromonas denitrificans DSM 6059 TaxID=1123010 RepID=A0A1I1TPF2_9GAMM|nr:TolC family protein [Pseudoalteromonas denitrificans]SFD60404.1 outer membrane protein, cobalt-zinc-cadmium efflux system [Pseudoalteromonas denitrificans DSM 6059]